MTQQVTKIQKKLYQAKVVATPQAEQKERKGKQSGKKNRKKKEEGKGKQSEQEMGKEVKTGVGKRSEVGELFQKKLWPC